MSTVTQASFPLSIPQRATFSKTIQLLYLDKTPVILTSWTAKMQIRKSYVDTAVIVELNTENAVGQPQIIITGSTGTVQMLIPATITKDLPVLTDAVYDLLLIAPAPDPTVSRTIQGVVSITPGSTHLS